jgi:CRP-like cAMP-binding protein
MIGEALFRHLSSIGDVSPSDREALQRVKGEIRTLPKGKDILSAGDVPHFAVVVLKGFLCRHSWKRSGRRQIHSFYIPTDAPSLETLHIDYMDSSLGAVVTSSVAIIPHPEMFSLMRGSPQVQALLWRATLIQAAVYREWLTRNSTLPAHSALAHLFCEMFVRAEAAGLVEGDSCELPTTQEILGHALGLTAVHVNRTLQLLRERGLIDLKNGRLYVPEFDKLAELGEFDPYYLHLRNGRSTLRASGQKWRPTGTDKLGDRSIDFSLGL